MLNQLDQNMNNNQNSATTNTTTFIIQQNPISSKINNLEKYRKMKVVKGDDGPYNLQYLINKHNKKQLYPIYLPVFNTNATQRKQKLHKCYTLCITASPHYSSYSKQEIRIMQIMMADKGKIDIKFDYSILKIMVRQSNKHFNEETQKFNTSVSQKEEAFLATKDDDEQSYDSIVQLMSTKSKKLKNDTCFSNLPLYTIQDSNKSNEFKTFNNINSVLNNQLSSFKNQFKNDKNPTKIEVDTFNQTQLNNSYLQTNPIINNNYMQSHEINRYQYNINPQSYKSIINYNNNLILFSNLFHQIYQLFNTCNQYQNIKSSLVIYQHQFITYYCNLLQQLSQINHQYGYNLILHQINNLFITIRLNYLSLLQLQLRDNAYKQSHLYNIKPQFQCKTIPPYQSLLQLTSYQLSSINGIKIYNQYGSILFLQSIDLTNIKHLHSLIKIEFKFIYIDQRYKAKKKILVFYEMLDFQCRHNIQEVFQREWKVIQGWMIDNRYELVQFQRQSGKLTVYSE